MEELIARIKVERRCYLFGIGLGFMVIINNLYNIGI